MRKLLSLVLIFICLSTPVCSFADVDVASLTREERNALLSEILAANASDMIGKEGEIRQFNTISRDNPVVMGQTAVFGLTKSGFDIRMTLKDVLYGEDALKFVKEANSFNAEPKNGMEYVIVKFTVTATTESKKADSIEFKEDDFEFVSRSGAVYKKREYIVGLDDVIELYNGGVDELVVIHSIDKGDVPFVLLLNSIWFDAAK